MGARHVPMKLQLVNCGRQCRMNPLNIPDGKSTVIHDWWEKGWGAEKIIAEAKTTLGLTFSLSATARHRKKHLQPVPTGAPGAPAKPVSELDLINQMIAVGGQQVQAGQFQMTAEQLLRAIELKLKLTQGSVNDAMYEAMRAATRDLDAEFDADEEGKTADPAPLSNEEREQGATSDEA